jgi:hypothetical protein
MAKTWKEIISDSKSFPDDFTIDIGGEKYAVGDLRRANSESGGEIQRQLDARKTELDTREATLGQAQQELANLFQTFSEKTGLTLEDVTNGKTITTANAKKVAAGATGLDPNDPILAPVIAQITELKDKEIAGLNAKIGDLSKAVGMALKVNLDDHYEREYGEISKTMPKDAMKDLDLNKVLKYAGDNKIMDRHGRFNLKKATDEMTADTRRAAEIAEAEERGRRKAIEEGQIASVSRPGARAAHLTNSPKNTDGSTKTIEQAMADAANDPDIWKNALATAGTGVVQ